jgi:hypothetical protein
VDGWRLWPAATKVGTREAVTGEGLWRLGAGKHGRGHGHTRIWETRVRRGSLELLGWALRPCVVGA